MNVYKTRPGIVLTEIAGEYALVAARSLEPLCPPVSLVNESSAFLWRQLQAGATMPELTAAAEREYEIEDREAAEAAIRAFIQQMLDMHYLLTE